RGPAGVEVWSYRVEEWLRAALGGEPVRYPWYVGRPLLVTDNDYELQLFNGDTGVVVRGAAGEPAAVFERRGQLVTVSPSRLGRVETLHAMTIHKSQGSQFDAVTVILPEIDSPILTRQLLYTAITRARRRVTLVGPEVSFRAAIDRPIARASGLGDRLWT
ncbi:MAG: ATP-binding domain-containing protein, partial [Acidimicrobiales bacterium]